VPQNPGAVQGLPLSGPRCALREGLNRALRLETHENRLEANRYLDMDDLRELKTLAIRETA
jgi:hypothetical protein